MVGSYRLDSDPYGLFMATRKIASQIIDMVIRHLDKYTTIVATDYIDFSGPCTEKGFLIVFNHGLPQYLITPWGLWKIYQDIVEDTISRQDRNFASYFVGHEFWCRDVLTGSIGDPSTRYGSLGPLYAVYKLGEFEISSGSYYPTPTRDRVNSNRRGWERLQRLHNSLKAPPLLVEDGRDLFD